MEPKMFGACLIINQIKYFAIKAKIGSTTKNTVLAPLK